MTKKLKIDKKDMCDLSDKEIVSKLNIQKLNNSKACIIEYDGNNYFSKNCNPSEILKKVKKTCQCGCDGKIRL